MNNLKCVVAAYYEEKIKQLNGSRYTWFISDSLYNKLT